ncbi:DUF4399 domain-containing protein [Gilvimarinus sp. SDUM040013]|uniref:DUF4399 domain-containing protein n=1 Tax=Gilvimarinus gilvus TaxID=3058038 RepID=A0ABU4RVN5_9GAMM|nr:DUF4399 domain-containing protein [Gilvimarinus sp. SDUM040013]MDO3386739.1 DUF4399 domain-containing protein [Gilvimarinus sp. SDUM040013]MDX6848331.1 DUF4399 domain-containing protein [Gilvimarinus sp. SDUM040013]
MFATKLKLTLGTLTLAMTSLTMTASAEDADVYFISPADGSTVSSPVKVQFGLTGMGVAPAGVERSNTGHHHLLIDVDTPPAPGQTIPSDENHRHFGGGQTETTLELSPGTHTLQLLVGDHLHRPHATPVMSEKISITVE